MGHQLLHLSKILNIQDTNFTEKTVSHHPTAQHIHIKHKRRRRKQQQWSTSFVCPTHLFFLFTEPFVNVTFSIQPIHQYLVQYFNRYRYISSEQNDAMTKNFSLWSNKVDQKPDRGDHCWSNHSLTEVQRNKYGDLLTYVCFNEFFDLDQLWYLMLVENHVCWQIGFFMHKAWFTQTPTRNMVVW